MQNSCILPCHAACTIAVHLRGAFYNKHSIPSSSQRVIFASDTANIHLSLNAGMLACTHIDRWTDNIFLLLQPFISERGTCASSVPCFNIFTSATSFHVHPGFTCMCLSSCPGFDSKRSRAMSDGGPFRRHQCMHHHFGQSIRQITLEQLCFLSHICFICFPDGMQPDQTAYTFRQSSACSTSAATFILERTTEVTCRVCRRPAKDVQS